MNTHAWRDRDGAYLVQFTDTHLFEDVDGKLLGIPTYASFELVLKHARQHFPQPAAYLVTGDLTQEPKPQSYELFHSLLGAVETSTYIIPGNHDDFQVMREVFAEKSERLAETLECGRWRITLLDSTVPEKEHGWLADEELGRLEKELDDHPDRFHIIGLHHPAVNLGSKWVDQICLLNADSLFDLIHGRESVKAVIWGHAHQEYDQMLNGTRLLGTPSTCFQFKPRQDEFGIDQISPGYRVLFLGDDGALKTRVERLAEYPFQVDGGSSGY